MKTQTIQISEPIFSNISPEAFQMWATHFYKCKQDFVKPEGFSPVPYFLLCRAIELQLKSFHLIEKRQPEVKKDFGHNLKLSYKKLDKKFQIPDEKEFAILCSANSSYSSKGFEYFKPYDAMTGYSEFPNCNELDAIARKFLEIKI